MEIISNRTKVTKEFVLLGEVFFLNPKIKWLAVDPNGDMYGYEEDKEPFPRENEWCVDWGGVWGVGVVDLQDTDWKDTLVKV